MHALLLSHIWLFCNAMDCNPQGSSVHRTFQGRILEWVAISDSRGLPEPGIEWTSISCISCAAGGFFTTVPPVKPSNEMYLWLKFNFQTCLRSLTLTWNWKLQPQNMHILPRIFTKDFTTITVYLQWLRRITEGGGGEQKRKMVKCQYFFSK